MSVSSGMDSGDRSMFYFKIFVNDFDHCGKAICSAGGCSDYIVFRRIIEIVVYSPHYISRMSISNWRRNDELLYPRAKIRVK